EIADFVAAEIKDKRAPILMRALAWIFVLVKGGAVIFGEGPIIARKMRGHPIDDDADTGLVKAIDEELEVVRRAVTMRGGVEAGDLIAPRRIIGVFGDGEKFDVREAHRGDVFDEFVSE